MHDEGFVIWHLKAFSIKEQTHETVSPVCQGSFSLSLSVYGRLLNLCLRTYSWRNLPLCFTVSRDGRFTQHICANMMKLDDFKLAQPQEVHNAPVLIIRRLHTWLRVANPNIHVHTFYWNASTIKLKLILPSLMPREQAPLLRRISEDDHCW